MHDPSYRNVETQKLCARAKQAGKRCRYQSKAGGIPEIRLMEAGVNISSSNTAYNAVLLSEFKNSRDLEIYQNHPEHKKVQAF